MQNNHGRICLGLLAYMTKQEGVPEAFAKSGRNTLNEMLCRNAGKKKIMFDVIALNSEGNAVFLFCLHVGIFKDKSQVFDWGSNTFSSNPLHEVHKCDFCSMKS